MGRKGKTARLKRKPAPRFWPIHRKEDPWVLKPSSGPHNLQNCLPMSLVLRDILGIAATRKEAQIILHQGKVLVDGKVLHKDDFPVGLMDVISMHDAEQILPNHAQSQRTIPESNQQRRNKLQTLQNRRQNNSNRRSSN